MGMVAAATLVQRDSTAIIVPQHSAASSPLVTTPASSYLIAVKRKALIVSIYLSPIHHFTTLIKVLHLLLSLIIHLAKFTRNKVKLSQTLIKHIVSLVHIHQGTGQPRNHTAFLTRFNYVCSQWVVISLWKINKPEIRCRIWNQACC